MDERSRLEQQLVTAPSYQRDGKTFFEFMVYDPPTPMGRKRTRFVKDGIAHYPEKKDVRSQSNIRKAFLDAYPQAPVILADVPVKVSIKMWHPCPKSMSRKKRIAAWMRPVVVTKPDINNVVNQIFDALSKYAYADDKQVTWLGDVMMFYAIDREGNDGRPRMLVTVEEL